MDAYWQVLRRRMAQDMGWSYEYIDSLPLEEIQNYLGLLDAEAKLKEK